VQARGALPFGFCIDVSYLTTDSVSLRRCLNEIKFNGFIRVICSFTFGFLGKNRRFKKELEKRSRFDFNEANKYLTTYE
jgi:hypothetical protein